MPLVLLAVLVCALVGALLPAQTAWAWPVDHLVAILGQFGHDSTLAVAALFGVHDGMVLDLLTWVSRPAVPAMACLVVAEALRCGKQIRRLGACLIILVALASFAVLPPTSAAYLLALGVAASVLLVVVTSTFILAPVAGFSAFLAARVVVLAVHAQGTVRIPQADSVLGLGQWWTAVYAAVACTLVATAAARLLRP